MTQQELARYQAMAQDEQEEALDASPDLDYDLDDELDLLWQDELQRYYAATRL